MNSKLYDTTLLKLTAISPFFARSLLDAAIKKRNRSPENISAIELLDIVKNEIDPKFSYGSSAINSLMQAGAGFIIISRTQEIIHISDLLVNLLKKIDEKMPLTFERLSHYGFVINGKECTGPEIRVINLPLKLGNIRVAFAPLYDDDKAFTGSISIIEDATLNVALEKEILLQNKKLELEIRARKEVALFAELSPFPIIRLLKNGLVNLANPAALKLFNPAALKLFNEKKVNWMSIDKRMNQKRLQELIANDSSLTYEFTYLHRVFLISYLGSSEFNTVNAYCFDITQLKEMKIELEQERAKRQELSKMAILGEMAGGLAHEINNPLAVTTLSLGQIKKILLKNEKLDKNLLLDVINDAEVATTRIAKIVDSFMSYSRNKVGDIFISSDLKEIIDESFMLCRSLLTDNNISYEVVYPEAENLELSIQCNPTQIMQVIVSCIRNAKDAISNLDDKWIKVEVQITDKGPIIQIIDSGKGISKYVQKKLFNPFFTTKEIGKGTGLGLSVSYGIIKNHHGNLYYKRKHKNTSFVIELPKAI